MGDLLRMVHEPETIDDPKAELQLGKDLFKRLDAEEALPRLERAWDWRSWYLRPVMPSSAVGL